MKSSLILFFVLIIASASYAQRLRMAPADFNFRQERFVPFYRIPGSIHFNLSNYMIMRVPSVGMPLNYDLQVTVFKNFTGGVLFTHYQFKQVSPEGVNASRFTGSDTKYNQFMLGAKASYHFNKLIEKIVNRHIASDIIDIYLTGWMGYSFARSRDEEHSEELIESNKKIRSGIALGARSMVIRRLGFFIEAGYSSFAYGSFGITVVLK